MRWLQAKCILLGHFLMHLWRLLPHLFSKPPNQLESFKKNYFHEAPLWLPTKEERAMFSEFSKCIHCGTCELDCAQLIQKPGLLFKPSWVAIACTRYSPDLNVAKSVVDVCGSCAGCTVVCPTQVPIKLMAGFVQSKLEAWKKQQS